MGDGPKVLGNLERAVALKRGGLNTVAADVFQTHSDVKRREKAKKY